MFVCEPSRREHRARIRLRLLTVLLGCACGLEPDYPADDPLPNCGDGEVGPDEECDDGNRADGDGCSAECLDRGSVSWTQEFDGPSGATDCGQGLALTPDGDIVVVGTASAGDTGKDMWIALMTPGGEVRWSRTSDGGAGYMDNFDDVGVAADGTIYVVGTKYSSVERVFAGDEDVHVEALSPEGERLWSTTMAAGSGVPNYATALTVDATGVVVVGGQRIVGASKAWSFKLDPEGELLWDVLDDSDLPAKQTPTDVAISPERDIYIIGYAYDSGMAPLEDPSYWLSRRSSTGDKVWTRGIGTATGDGGSDDASLAIDADGHLWVAYAIPGTSPSTADVRIERRSPDGALEFEDIYRGPANEDDHVRAIAVAPTGAIVLTGDTYVDGLQANIWLQVYDAKATIAWTRTIGEAGIDGGNAVASDAGHVYATGCIGSRWLPTDAWTAKFVL